jgi:hypothetical protein
VNADGEAFAQFIEAREQALQRKTQRGDDYLGPQRRSAGHPGDQPRANVAYYLDQGRARLSRSGPMRVQSAAASWRTSSVVSSGGRR